MAEVIIVKNQEEAGELYGRSVADLIKAKPNAVLGLATGSSPLAAYQALAEIVKEESIDVSQVQGFALDEYIGLLKQAGIEKLLDACKQQLKDFLAAQAS